MLTQNLRLLQQFGGGALEYDPALDQNHVTVGNRRHRSIVLIDDDCSDAGVTDFEEN